MAALFAVSGVEAALVTSYEVKSKASSLQSDVPLTVGQVFKAGDVPAGVELSFKGSAGEALLSQVDKKTFHADGSLRHAVVTTVIPALQGSAQQLLSLETQSSAGGGSAVSVAGLLATSFDAQVNLDVGGSVYALSARDLLSAGSYQTWLSGPLVSEWIVGGPVRRADGSEHAQLAAYFHVRAYAGYERVRVDVVVENGWTFVGGASDKNYGVDVRLNGSSVYQQNINHYNHARWHKQFWAGQQPDVYVKHDVAYLQATGAIPSYADLSPSEGYLNGLAQASTPMGNGSLTDYFPDPGAQAQIGPLPIWTTTYAVSGDERAYRNMLANDDSAGTYAAHFRDKQTGRPVAIADHPNATLQDGTVPQGSSSNPYTLDQAHQPSLGFLSYVVTGDYFYLEETQFWSSWNLLYTNSSSRGYEKGIFVLQVRGQGWALRSLGQAAYITPDSSPLKAQFEQHLQYNAEGRITDYSPGGSHYNNLGVIQGYDGNQAGKHKPWMDDFFTFAVGYLVQLGYNEYIPLRDFKAKYPVGRMDTVDYCYVHATEYSPGVGPGSGSWYGSFAEMYQANWGSNSSCPEGQALNGYPDNPDGYTSNFRPALAAAVHSNVPGAQEAWNRFLNSAVHPDYNDYPNWAVVPYGQTSNGTGPEPEPIPYSLDDLPAGYWVEVPGTNLEDVFPTPVPPGNSGPRSVMEAWSGGAFDTTRDRLIVWGGGHSDYAGNEIYVFDVDTMTWTRLTEPSSDVGGDESSGVYPDGLPRSRHTYGNVTYAPNVDSFISIGGAALWPNALTDSKTHLFDFSTKQWREGQPSSDLGWRYGAASYDPVTGKVFYFGGGSSGRFASYNPINDSFQYHARQSAEIYAVSAIDPGRRIMVLVGGYGGKAQLFKLNLDNPNAAPVDLLPLSSGDTAMESAGGTGFAFDPVSDRFVAWHGGSSVYTLNPDTWVWTRVDPVPANITIPGNAQPNGTYGRFQYIPSKDVFIAVNRTNENVYFFRLSEEVLEPGPSIPGNAVPKSGGGASWFLVLLACVRLLKMSRGKPARTSLES